MSVCVDCTEDVEHCHATWVRHLDGHEECLSVSCRVDGDAHWLVVVCRELDERCCP